MLIDDYLSYTERYRRNYEKSIVLMQVGSFFEFYSLEKPEIDIICDILDIQSTKKNKSKPVVDRSNPYMAGIPLYVLDKYLDVLLDNGYTIIIIEQVTPPPNPKREVTRIISPATREIDNSPDNNYLMCLYFTTGSCKTGKFIMGSISYVDINTNKSYIFETSETDTQLNIQDIIKTINTHKPSELVVFTDIQTKSNEEFMNLLRSHVGKFSVVCIHNKIDILIDDNFFKLSYQKTLLQKVFKNTGLLSVIEYLNLETHPMSIVCYTYLLQFVYEHNEKIINGLSNPVFLENDRYLCLVNNVVDNLNIISNSNKKTDSLLNLLNNCKTSMGKRYFKQCLLNPLTDFKKIQKRYDLCDYFIQNDIYISCRNLLKEISDIERLFKRITTCNIQPYSFLSINKSLISFNALYNHLILYKCDFSNLNWSVELQNKLEKFMNYYQTRLNFDEIEKVNINQIKKNIFKQGIYPELDSKQEKIKDLENIFETVCWCLNGGMENKTDFKLEVSKGKDKAVRTIVVTKNRFDNMLAEDKKFQNVSSSLTKKCGLDLKDIITKPFSSSNTKTLKISFKNMDSKQIELIDLQNSLEKDIYNRYIEEIEYYKTNFSDIFGNIGEFISKIDFFSNNAYNSIENCYSRPIIVDNSNSFIKATKIRHPLIEKIQVDIPYVANDVEIGTDSRKGMLLYGQNSVGKSSYMKSIGINLIMAQAGLYTASLSFEFAPYDHIFTRIPGGDNLFKNQSTFVAEINELRTILKRSTARSLVIGDELASGTETISAISLVASGISMLSTRNTSFIFATHIHELCSLNCVKNLKNVTVNHLSVHFDTEKNCLIFDRILKEGNGDTLYGLEIAKSLDLPLEFILKANEIRQEYTGIQKNIVEPKPSTYNNLVFMDRCMLCDASCDEVHHITEQQFANSKGVLVEKQIHKNIKHNLLAVCSKCHDKIHSNHITVNGYTQTTNGIKLDVTKHDSKFNDSTIKQRCVALRNEGHSFTKILNIISKENEGINITLYKIKQYIKI